MTTNRSIRLAALPIVLGLVVTACGDDDGAEGTADTTAATTAAPATDTTDPADTAGEAETSSMVEECPETIVIQLDWFPSGERGMLMQLLGPGHVLDLDAKTITAPLVDTDGNDMGVDVQIRSGGPAIGFSPVTAQMYTDDSITLGAVSLDQAANDYAQLPTIAVVAPLEKNPQMIMWDPEAHPEVETIADVGELGLPINVFPGAPWQDILTKLGQVPASSWDGSYDGSPARFISSAGSIAQQGFASSEPFQYENSYAEWGRPVEFQLIFDAGVRFYSQPLAVRSADLDELSPCLAQFVPLVQQATVDYMADPSRANALIVEAVTAYDGSWTTTAADTDYASQAMAELGLVSNGPDDVIGNFDPARVQEGIDQMVDAGIDTVDADLTAEQLATNEFIDLSIGL